MTLRWSTRCRPQQARVTARTRCAEETRTTAANDRRSVRIHALYDVPSRNVGSTAGLNRGILTEHVHPSTSRRRTRRADVHGFNSVERTGPGTSILGRVTPASPRRRTAPSAVAPGTRTRQLSDRSPTERRGPIDWRNHLGRRRGSRRKADTHRRRRPRRQSTSQTLVSRSTNVWRSIARQPPRARSQRPSALAASTSVCPVAACGRPPAAVHLGDIDRGPVALRSAGRVSLQELGLVETLAMAGDPTPAEADIDCLVIGHRGDAGVLLGDLEPHAWPFAVGCKPRIPRRSVLADDASRLRRHGVTRRGRRCRTWCTGRGRPAARCRSGRSGAWR